MEWKENAVAKGFSVCYSNVAMKICALKRIVCLILVTMISFGFSLAYAEEDTELSLACSYSLPSRVPVERLTDDSLLTRLTVYRGKTISVTLPDCLNPVLYATWFELPEDIFIKQMDKNGEVISDQRYIPEAYYEQYPLSPVCRTVVLSSTTAMTISTLRFFEGKIPENLPVFHNHIEQADILFVMGQPQALLEEFSALVPLCTDRYQMTAAVCYLCSDSAVLKVLAGDPRPLDEATKALWTLGYHEAPFLGNFVDRDYNELDDIKKTWTDKELEQYLVNLIRSLRPKVVVCASGSETDQRSVYAGQSIENAVRMAADSSKYNQKDSLPAHSVQKLYLSDQNGNTVLSYDEDLFHAVSSAYHNCFATRQLYRKQIPEKSRLTLLLSSVGEDQKANDILENLDTGSFLTYTAPTPTATPEPTPEPTPVPTDTLEPTAVPTTVPPTAQPTVETTALPTAQAAETIQQAQAESFSDWYVNHGVVLKLTLLCVVVIAIVFAVAFRKKLRERNTKTVLIVLGVLVILLAGIICWQELFDADDRKTSEAAEDTYADMTAEAETAVSSPQLPEDSQADLDAETEPTATPTPEPTAEPTPTPTPDPYPFLPYGEQEKVEVFDEKEGKWVYRSDTLSVEVRRETYPLNRVSMDYYVAHIYTRDVDSFYATFATNRKTGLHRCDPQDMALRYKSVLWFTGDNLIQAEAAGKGILIRDGRVYSKNRTSNELAYYSETQSFSIIDRRAMDAVTLWESGTQDVFSFLRGADLVIDGKISKGATSVTQRNPRCAVGMVEPGHFVVIATNGREKGYVIGFRLTELAQLFLDEGCTLAYNLDGGISTSIFFLGAKLNKHGDEAGTGGIVDYQQRSLPEGLAWGYSELCGTLEH